MNTLCLAVPLFIYGLLAITARDLLWNLTEYGSALSGRGSYRSDAWETAIAASGYVCLVLAMFSLVF